MHISHVKSVKTSEGKLGFVSSQYCLIYLYSFGDEKKKIYDPPKILPQPLCPFGKVVWLVPMASKEKKT